MSVGAEPFGDVPPEMIVSGIVKALNDRRIGTVPILVRLLAVKDPKRATQVYDAMAAGIILADRYALHHDISDDLALGEPTPDDHHVKD